MDAVFGYVAYNDIPPAGLGRPGINSFLAVIRTFAALVPGSSPKTRSLTRNR